jgi:uncharacterized membrane protein AbrB (regulator of aidB expression)
MSDLPAPVIAGAALIVGVTTGVIVDGQGNPTSLACIDSVATVEAVPLDIVSLDTPDIEPGSRATATIDAPPGTRLHLPAGSMSGSFVVNAVSYVDGLLGTTITVEMTNLALTPRRLSALINAEVVE